MKKQILNKINALSLAAVLSVAAVAGTGIITNAAPTIGDDPDSGSLTVKKIDDGTLVEKEDANGDKYNDIEYKELEGAVYTAYKIMDITPDQGSPVYVTYSIVDAYEDVLGDIEPDDLGTYSSAQIEELTAKLLAAAPSADATDADKGIYVSAPTGSDGFTKISDMDLGYYLVVETTSPASYVASAPFLVAIPTSDNFDKYDGNTPVDPADPDNTGVNWLYDVTVIPKNEKITLSKEITNGSNDDDVKQDTVGEGDIVTYSVKSAIPKYADEYFDTVTSNGTTTYKYVVTYKISDILSDGLTLIVDGDDDYDNYPIVVKVDGTAVTPSDTTFKLTAESVKSDTVADLEVAFAQSYIEANLGKKVEVTYAAKVNADAVVGNEGNANDVTLTFSNKPGTAKDVDTATDENKVYTFAINVFKYTNEVSGTDTAPLALAGAEFELYTDADLTKKVSRIVTVEENGTSIEKEITTFVTDADGNLSIDRLDEGTYYLVETKAPVGYTLLSNPITVVIKAEIDTIGEFTGDLDTDDTDGSKVDGQPVAVIAQDTEDDDTYIDAENGVIHLAIENHKGFSLPATGGIGVFIFLAVALVGIVTICVVMKKKSEEE